MANALIYPVASTEGSGYASLLLEKAGYPLTDHPTPEITHLLLDVPSFQKNGCLRNGGDLCKILAMIPQNITVIGGNLNHPALEGYRKMDLLQSDFYLARNAAITAHCALQVAASCLKTTFADTSALIIGWGRIGKCLARLLKDIGCDVTVAVRKNTDLAMLSALGYPCISISEIPSHLLRFSLLFNTVPCPLFSEELPTTKNCIMIELSSENGLNNKDVIIARGLPGTYAPKSSGMLIANTILQLWKEEET